MADMRVSSSDSQPSAAAASGSALAATGTNATGTRNTRPRYQPSLRPVAVTKHGLRQFVETSYGVRLYLQNCLATVNLKTQPDLAYIATHARNADYNPKRFPAVIVKIREPKSTALVFNSGKMVLTGAQNEDDARSAAKKMARIIQRLGSNVSFSNFQIQNLVGTCDVTFPIRLEGLADEHGLFSSYEPELFAGLVYRMQNPKVVLLIFVSGNIVVTGAKTRSQIVEAFDKIYPVLLKYRKAPVEMTSSNAARTTRSRRTAANP